MPNLFSLFDDDFNKPSDLAASAPQSFDTISSLASEQEQVLTKIRNFETASFKVDYSDFSNFVFFNSALDYFNITGEKILNEYPYDQSIDAIETFNRDLDGYQKYLYSIWPKCVGHLKFDPTQGFAYVTVNDVGYENGATRTGFLSPSTGSFSLEFWCMSPPSLTGSDAMVVAQKSSGSQSYSAWFSGSQFLFSVASGSFQDVVSIASAPSKTSYFSCVYDRSSATPTISVMTGSIDSFPVLIASSSISVLGSIDMGSSNFVIGSGSFASKKVRPFSGSLDELRVWSVPLSIADLSSSFNTKAHAQDGLTALWRFNESGSISGYNTSDNKSVVDSSGHKLNGVLTTCYVSGTLRDHSSLLPFDSEDPILFFQAQEVQDLVADQQSSGSAYDRDNDNIITRLIPDKFLQLEIDAGTSVLQNFLYILARNFDQIKTSIDQFVHVNKSNYGEFDQTPDALLEDIGRFFGWEFTGNFLNSNASQYIFGKNVLPNTEANSELEVKLYEIKNEFWKRVLINLMYLYKSKGTRESIEALTRIYGVNSSFVRLKEYGAKSNVGINTTRINAEKSCYAISTDVGRYVYSSASFKTYAQSIETMVRFPTMSSVGLTPTITTGTIYSLSSYFNPPGSYFNYALLYQKPSAGSLTGDLIFFDNVDGGGGITLTLSGAAIFDDRWHNVIINRDYLSSSLNMTVQSVQDGEIIDRYSVSETVSPVYSLFDSYTKIGMLVPFSPVPGQAWVQEFRVWDDILTQTEIDDHTLNFQSHGTEEIAGQDKLKLHLRLNDGPGISPFSLYENVTGSFSYNISTGSSDDTTAFKKFLNEYNFISPPDAGWIEDKIRIFNKSSLTPADAFSDDRTVALEFNMVDALNEDISQIFATMDTFNEIIGSPVNSYRDEYTDLATLRHEYFQRLQGRLNFRLFADMLEFFDRSFINMIKKLIPARAHFIGDEFVVESHMLERSKVRWNYRRQEQSVQIEGMIKVYSDS